MSYVRRGVLSFLCFATALLAFPSFAATLQPKAASRGMIVGSKSVDAEANVVFSGNFSYSIGGGNAVLKADTVTNPNGTATGPLRFALWWTPTPYPSAGNIVATCDITPSLAANSSISPVNVAIRPVRSRRRRPAVTASRSCSRRMSAGPGRRATTATSP